MKYFDHDTTANKDDSIQLLKDEYGLDHVAAYWYLLERIYEAETDLVFAENQTLTKVVCHWLGVGFDGLIELISHIQEVGLLDISMSDEETYVVSSKRANENIKAYQDRVETARSNGKKGGRKTKPLPNPNPILTQPKTKEKEKEKEKEIISSKKKQEKKKFKPPTREEAEAYRIKTELTNVDTDSFLDHYEANGWVQGKGKPVKDWKACMRNWNRRSQQWQQERRGNADFGEYNGALGF